MDIHEALEELGVDERDMKNADVPKWYDMVEAEFFLIALAQAKRDRERCRHEPEWSHGKSGYRYIGRQEFLLGADTDGLVFLRCGKCNGLLSISDFFPKDDD
jgi:hypothetical protein